MSSSGSILLHLGAGRAQLDRFLLSRNDYKTTVMVEGDPSTAATLVERWAGDNSVLVEECVVVPESSDRVFHSCTLPPFSSVSKPVALHTLYSSVNFTTGRCYSFCTISELLQRLGLDTQGEVGNSLVIETLGIQHTILKELHDNDFLQVFADIAVLCEGESYFEDTEEASAIVSFLEELGYERQTTNTDDPEFPAITFTYNPVVKELDRVRKELDVARVENRQAEQKLAVGTKEIELLREQLNVTKDARDAAEARVEAAATAQTAAERQLADQLNKGDEMRKRIMDLEAKNGDLRYRLSLMQDEMAKAEGQIGLIRELLVRETST